MTAKRVPLAGGAVPMDARAEILDVLADGNIGRGPIGLGHLLLA